MREDIEQRFREIEALREAYPHFPEFLYDVVTKLLGFNCTKLQLDIALYLEFGPKYRMIQAQRGQAKTTITACYAAWRLIHEPRCRILIVSSGDKMASEISNWIIQIIMGMDELKCLRPDKTQGDRTSIKAFDIHYSLKGPEKSPSIACMGISANMQGVRADLLIPDDIESSKNSTTEVQRERLNHLTRDFTSINSNGDIVYLGTPQSTNSVYNTLIGRGFNVRIWPGRYPTVAEEKNYGGLLAPYITKAMKEDPSLREGGGPLGDRGKPTDPELLNEEALSVKEIDQGKAYFQLQHMLDTRLMDADRFPLKLSDLVFLDFGLERCPITIDISRSEANRVTVPPDFPVNEPLYRATLTSLEHGAFQGTVVHVDPAGGGKNADETGIAVASFAAGKIFVQLVTGVKGGFDANIMEYISNIAKRYKATSVTVEKNFGNGAFTHILMPIIQRIHPCGVEEVWATGQKELRVIDTLEPVMSSSRLIMHPRVLEEDQKACYERDAEKRVSYSLFHQMARITRDKNSLLHDDRIDALTGAVRFWVEDLKQDEKKARARAAKKNYDKLMSNPLGNGRPVKGFTKTTRALNALDDRKRISNAR